MGRKQKRTPSARALVAAFACVAVSFLLATLASEWSDVRIRRDAAQITRTAAPSIVHMEAFRSEARRLVVLADDEVDSQALGLSATPAAMTDEPGQLEAETMKIGELTPQSPPVRGVHVPVGTSAAEAERRLILATLEHYGGDKNKAARMLGVSLKTTPQVLPEQFAFPPPVVVTP